MIVKEAVANGRLTERGDVQPFKDAAGSAGTTPDALALAVALAQPWADVVLSGATTADMLASNLKACELELEESVLDRIASVREDPHRYWETRAGLVWN